MASIDILLQDDSVLELTGMICIKEDLQVGHRFGNKQSVYKQFSIAYSIINTRYYNLCQHWAWCVRCALADENKSAVYVTPLWPSWPGNKMKCICSLNYIVNHALQRLATYKDNPSIAINICAISFWWDIYIYQCILRTILYELSWKQQL